MTYIIEISSVLFCLYSESSPCILLKRSILLGRFLRIMVLHHLLLLLLLLLLALPIPIDLLLLPLRQVFQLHREVIDIVLILVIQVKHVLLILEYSN